jgi:hypothetical protein
MSFTYQIDADAGMIFVVGKGETTQAERFEVMQAWMNDPAFRPGLHILCDFSAATTPPTLAELGEIVAFIKRNAAVVGKKRVAVVAADPMTFGAARQFQALSHAGPHTVQLFNNRESALAWLREA